MDYATLRYEVADGLLILTLNRPERMNAFTTQMADELVHAFRRVNDDENVRAVIVTGAGKAFCVGMDLSVSGNVFGLDESQRPTLDDMHDRLHDRVIEQGVRDTGGRVTLAIFECTKPVIAAVNGVAVGIGATMTLAMDIRLASESAKFGFVFGKIGIVPEACSSWFLPRVVGLSQALEWVYTADIFDAQEAQRGRLVKAVVPPGQLLDEAKKLARRIIDSRSPVAIALARQMLYRNSAQAHPLEAHRVDSLAVFYTSLRDGKEGVQSFMEKRSPRFEAMLPRDLPPFYAEWTREPR
ncbi:MAG TPA: crotonase/enoyl-CoA hydratase family protein [Povalibacter sp.]|uniref:crotonase/enoyl-CoA hydratase family protein n=1 Tax=Povalibacter sp. TaxID=1962978 RepID=UPI002CF28BAE|nr:crotonase/enoyl-CoA hydratase family protein [Povalibacter sp.]HMN43264.1 crotonase/enoyl-CoA hydratase family protein [Povalibacter sp.]